MADDSWDVEETMDFYPCDKPHGMKDYILTDLTQEQQIKLNERKCLQVKSDQKYLAKHPEIRGIIQMILRILMKTKPKYDLYHVIGTYFTNSSEDIKEEVENYLKEKERILSVNSAILKSESASEDYSESVYSKLTEEAIAPMESGSEVSAEVTEIEEGKRTSEDIEKGTLLMVSDKDQEVSQIDLENLKLLEEEEKLMREDINICQEVMETILEQVFDEDDLPSLDSTGSTGFVAAYQDQDIVLRSSSDSDDTDDDD